MPRGYRSSWSYSNNTISLSNGDTEDWVRFDYPAYGETGTTIKAIITHALSGDSKIWDMRRKCWFIRAEHIDTLIKGLREIMKDGRVLDGWTINDKRVKVESFEEFFEDAPTCSTPKATKDDLILNFKTMLLDVLETLPAISDFTSVNAIKPYYRKAALALHPDRNNGDGSRMSELNRVWAELQTYL